MRNLAIALIVALCAAPLSASADTLPTVYAGLIGGYSPSTGDTEVDPMGVALGARGGLTIPMTDLYVGALFLYHMGDSATVLNVETTLSSFMLGGEIGYEIGVPFITLRPSIGLGLNNTSADVEGTIAGFGASGSTSEGDFYISPGINAMLTFGVIYAGAEVRYNGVFSDEVPDSLSLLGSLGVTL